MLIALAQNLLTAVRRSRFALETNPWGFQAYCEGGAVYAILIPLHREEGECEGLLYALSSRTGAVERSYYKSWTLELGYDFQTFGVQLSPQGLRRVVEWASERVCREEPAGLTGIAAAEIAVATHAMTDAEGRGSPTLGGEGESRL